MKNFINPVYYLSEKEFLQHRKNLFIDEQIKIQLTYSMLMYELYKDHNCTFEELILTTTGLANLLMKRF